MSFNGIFVWDAKNGLPTSYDDARDMETQVSQHAPKEINPAFMAVAQAVQDFIKEAQEYYDDHIIDMYRTMPDWVAEDTDPILSFDNLPEELYLALSATVVKAAQLNNLVVLHQDLEVVFLPDGSVLADHSESGEWEEFVSSVLGDWQAKLIELKKAAQADDNTVPQTSGKLNSLINKVVKARFKEAGVKDIKKKGATGYYIDLGRIQISLDIYAKIDRHFLEDNGKARAEFMVYMTLYVNDIERITIKSRLEKERHRPLNASVTIFEHMITKFFNFYEIPHTPAPNWKYYLNDEQELREAVNKAADMLLYVYPHCQTLESLYHFLQHQDQDPYIRPYAFRGGYRGLSNAEQMLYLARLTKQPNYDALVDIYKAAFLEEVAQSYLQGIKFFNARERYFMTGKEEEGKYKAEVLPDIFAAFYTDIYEQFVDYLAQLDVDAVLAKDPVISEDLYNH